MRLPSSGGRVNRQVGSGYDVIEGGNAADRIILPTALLSAVDPDIMKADTDFHDTFDIDDFEGFHTRTLTIEHAGTGNRKTPGSGPQDGIPLLGGVRFSGALNTQIYRIEGFFDETDNGAFSDFTVRGSVLNVISTPIVDGGPFGPVLLGFDKKTSVQTKQ